MSREPSILRNPHRELLRGEREPSSSYERKMKTKMRERVRDGIIDFSLLLEESPPELRQDVFKGVSDRSLGEGDTQISVDKQDLDEGVAEPGIRAGFYGPNVDVLSKTSSKLEQGMIDAIAFLYIAAEDAGIDPQNLIERGVTEAEDRLYDDRWLINSVSLEVDRSVQNTLAEKALKKISEGDELTNAEVRALLESGRGNLTPEQIQGYLTDEWKPPEDEMIDPSSGV